jgi:Spy/CpxP family protein refolding chaperone
MNQRHSIEQSTHAQVEAVCADPSLSTPQKREKIKEIRQQAKQEVEGIITPEQQQELKACNASRAAAHPPQPAPHPGPAPGPCANLGSASPASPQRELRGVPENLE